MAKYKLSDIFEGNYPVSQVYGNNPQYYQQYGLNGHEGIDYATPIGIPILAPFDGVVLRDNDDFKNNAYGNFIVLWDKVQKIAVWWCHLSGNNVSVGQEFKRGQVLGKTGISGNSSGPHLHANLVETDASGNRLNMNNGKQGFLNLLDKNLVEWIPIGTPPITNSPSGGTGGTVDNRGAVYDTIANGFPDRLKVNGDTHSATVKQGADFVAWVKDNVDRAGKYDLLIKNPVGISEADKNKYREEGRKQGVKESREKLQNALNSLA